MYIKYKAGSSQFSHLLSMWVPEGCGGYCQCDVQLLLNAGPGRHPDQAACHQCAQARLECVTLDLGRSALALGIANIFIGMFLSSLAYKNIIAQAVVLGGLFIIVMLKNDIEYLLVGCTPAEEEERMRAAGFNGRW